MSDRDFVAFWREDFVAEGDLAPLPFRELFDDLVEEAERQVARNCPRGYRSLLEAARSDITRSLRRTLTDLCAQPLDQGFAIFRQARRSTDHPGTDYANRAALYSEYVRRPETLADELRVHPALEPLLEIARRDWVDATTELLLHLEQDKSALELQLAGGRVGPVAAVGMDLSDRHTHGRTVTRLAFEDGRRVVHKPRHVGLERAYNRLLERLNREGLVPDLRPLWVVERAGYGWVEGVEAEPCRTADEAHLFYRRAGMLLALWWALGGTDCHLSNVFACGPQPVLVDAEMFFRISVAESGDTDLDRLHFLPRRDLDGDVESDITGLGGVATQPTAYRVPVWLHPGTDDARLCHRPALLRSQSNGVLLDGTRQRASRHASRVLGGFGEMCAILEKLRKPLIDPGGMLEEMQRQPRRVVYRRTRDYYGILNASLAARQLRDPERLGYLRRQLDLVSASVPDEVREVEARALDRLDIPRFSEQPPPAERDPGYQAVRERLAALEGGRTEALLRQVRLALAVDSLGQ